MLFAIKRTKSSPYLRKSVEAFSTELNEDTVYTGIEAVARLVSSTGLEGDVKNAELQIVCVGEQEGEGEFVSDGQEEQEEAVNPAIACPKCGGKMVQRRSRFGLFLGCAAYPKCKGTRKV